MNSDLRLEQIIRHNIESCNHMLGVLEKLSSSLDEQCLNMHDKSENKSNNISLEDMECATELSNSVLYVRKAIDKFQELLQGNLKILDKIKNEHKK